jgi:hypothetical protein
MLFLDRYVVFIPPSTLFGVVMKTKRFTKHRTCETAAAAAAKSANLPNSEDEVRRIPGFPAGNHETRRRSPKSKI